MFDDLRNEAESTPFFQDNEPDISLDEQPKKPGFSLDGKILGMTPGQRLIIAAMLAMVTCILGSMLLLVMGVVNPF